MSFFPKHPSSRAGMTQTVAFDGSAAPLTVFSPETYQLRLVANSACCYRIGDGPQVATSFDIFLPANAINYVIVSPGQHRRHQGAHQRAGHGHRRHPVDHGNVVMNGVLIRPHLDHNGKDLAIEHIQDVEPILEWNKQARRDEQHGDWGRHVARIPNVIYVRWLDEQHARGNAYLRMFTPEFDRIVQNKLADPEWAYLRTDRPKLQAGWSAELS